MIEKEQLCNKIRDIYPDIGECGIDLNVDYDEKESSWIVNLERGDQKLKTFLEEDDAKGCIEGKKCINLGVQIAQLRDQIKKT